MVNAGSTTGQKILVELTKVDDRGKLSLSPVIEGEDGASEEDSE